MVQEGEVKIFVASPGDPFPGKLYVTNGPVTNLLFRVVPAVLSYLSVVLMWFVSLAGHKFRRACSHLRFATRGHVHCGHGCRVVGHRSVKVSLRENVLSVYDKS